MEVTLERTYAFSVEIKLDVFESLPAGLLSALRHTCNFRFSFSFCRRHFYLTAVLSKSCLTSLLHQLFTTFTLKITFCFDKVNYSAFKKIVFRKWLTCMEDIFQITKETAQNINLDFQLKATYSIDFYVRVTYSEAF